MEIPPPPLPLDPSRESETRQLISTYLREIHQPNVEKNVEELMSFSGFEDRFGFFLPLIDESAKDRMLISGCAIGSEHLVARRLGWQEIYGTEVTDAYVQIAKARLGDQQGMFVDLYDGHSLPYEDGKFSFVYSGHVIEHTPDPLAYFREHYRVLRTGGFFFLEFPCRYHRLELHTGVRSFEWLPKRLRAPFLRFLGGPRSPLDERKKLCYRDILATLSPISVWQLRMFLRRCGGGKVIAVSRPVPGFVRVLIRK